jgi:hypothetical protein
MRLTPALGISRVRMPQPSFGKQTERWKPAKCAPPARSSALGSAPRDASPSLSLHDSASHRRGTSRAPRGMRRRKDRAVETITTRNRTFRCTFLETFISPIFATRRFSKRTDGTRAESRIVSAFPFGPPKKRARSPKSAKKSENAFNLFFRVPAEGNLAFFREADHSDFSTWATRRGSDGTPAARNRILTGAGA